MFANKAKYLAPIAMLSALTSGCKNVDRIIVTAYPFEADGITYAAELRIWKSGATGKKLLLRPDGVQKKILAVDYNGGVFDEISVTTPDSWQSIKNPSYPYNGDETIEELLRKAYEARPKEVD